MLRGLNTWSWRFLIWRTHSRKTFRLIVVDTLSFAELSLWVCFSCFWNQRHQTHVDVWRLTQFTGFAETPTCIPEEQQTLFKQSVTTRFPRGLEEITLLLLRNMQHTLQAEKGNVPGWSRKWWQLSWKVNLRMWLPMTFHKHTHTRSCRRPFDILTTKVKVIVLSDVGGMVPGSLQQMNLFATTGAPGSWKLALLWWGSLECLTRGGLPQRVQGPGWRTETLIEPWELFPCSVTARLFSSDCQSLINTANDRVSVRMHLRHQSTYKQDIHSIDSEWLNVCGTVIICTLQKSIKTEKGVCVYVCWSPTMKNQPLLEALYY